LKGRGNQHPTKFFFGDLFIKIKINNKPFVSKNGYDTQSTLNMSVSEAVLGGYMKYHTYYGDKMMNI
jgi:DnaJ-class molecular chaperone